MFNLYTHKYILRKMSEVSKSNIEINKELVENCKNGYTASVKKLVTMGGADPTYMWCSPMREAYLGSHLDIIKFFVEERFTNRFELYNIILEFNTVCKNEITDYLIKDSRDRYSSSCHNYHNNLLLKFVSVFGELEDVTKLLNRNTDIKNDNYFCFRFSPVSVNLDIVKLLLPHEQERTKRTKHVGHEPFRIIDCALDEAIHTSMFIANSDNGESKFKDSMSIIEFLLENGADPEYGHCRGYFCCFNDYECSKYKEEERKLNRLQEERKNTREKKYLEILDLLMSYSVSEKNRLKERIINKEKEYPYLKDILDLFDKYKPVTFFNWK